MIRVSVIGATGYAGAELVRLLLAHPNVTINMLCSKSNPGQTISGLWPNLSAGIVLEDLDIAKCAKTSDVVFTALPHGVSAETSRQLAGFGTRVIDLSGDLRYDDETVYEKWYGAAHPCPGFMKSAVYGMSELYAEKIKTAQVVANPGCYTTCSILTLYPLLAAGLIDKSGIVIDAKSAVSGAGRKADLGYSFCETDENVKAYSIARHRHTSEIEQELSKAAGSAVVLSFTPHLIPVKRGILSTIYTNLHEDVSFDEVSKCFAAYYADEPFVKICGRQSPEIKHVNGSNRLDIGFETDPRTNRLILVSALDNLIKGAAGQAIQNMNIMFGLSQTAGLPLSGYYL